MPLAICSFGITPTKVPVFIAAFLYNNLMRIDSQPVRADYSTKGRRLLFLIAIAVVIGVIAACIAKLLLVAIGLVTNLTYFGRAGENLVQPSHERWGLFAILIPAFGGLAVGLIARFCSEKIRGHGIPEAIQSVLRNDSIVQARLVFWKPIASAIAIGTGSPFGAEGPIIMTGGGFGSLLAQFLHVSAFERRTLLVAGAAAGMSATFAAPIASVLIAIELLLFEWRPRSFVPVAAASFVAAAVRTIFLGSQSPFTVSTPTTMVSTDFGWAVVLGIIGGLVSLILTKLVYLTEDAYEKLPIHWMWWPAIGGLCIGIGGWFVPAALGVGYPTITAMLNGQLALGAVVGIVVVKTIIWIVALSSGTSGGVLAPLLMIGAGCGTLFGTMVPGHHEAAWAVVGMAALMGGTMRAPFMGTLFALETTQAWGLAPEICVACIAATALTVVLVPRSILTEKLARRGMHVAREYSVDPLELVTVMEVMAPPLDVGDETLPRIHQNQSVREVAKLMSSSEARQFVVVDSEEKIIGSFGVEELLRSWQRNDRGESRRTRVRHVRRFWMRRGGV